MKKFINVLSVRIVSIIKKIENKVIVVNKYFIDIENISFDAKEVT